MEKGLKEYAAGIMAREHKRPSKLRPSIGFEFEIPLNYECSLSIEEGELHYYELDYNKAWWKEAGYLTHFECGGLEVCSPVHFNISQARATAEHLMEYVKSIDCLDPYREADQFCDCGIHVHAGAMNYDSVQLTRLINLVLNRTSSKDKVWKMSGRTHRGTYYKQAVSSQWDTSFSGGEVYTKPNAPCGVATVEYRLFAGTQDRLLPAIDFAHSFTRWAGIQLEKLGDMNRWSLDKLKELVPYFSDYENWLHKQPGYEAVKEDLKGE